MEKPDYKPTADIIRQTVLQTVADYAVAGKSLMNVDQSLADAIADSVLARLGSLEEQRKHAQIFDITEALLTQLSKLFQPSESVDQRTSDFILATIRQNRDAISTISAAILDALEGAKVA